VGFFRKSTVIFPEISGKILQKNSGNFSTYNPTRDQNERYDWPAVFWVTSMYHVFCQPYFNDLLLTFLVQET